MCESVKVYFPDYFLMNEIERDSLANYAKGKKILELGSFMGKSAAHMAKSGAIEILCIDTFNCDAVPGITHFDTFQHFLTNISPHPQISFLPMNTREAHKYIPNHYFDVLLIDADHSYGGCLHDLVHYSFKVKKGGCILLHDYSFQFLGVKMAAHIFFDHNPDELNLSLAMWKK